MADGNQLTGQQLKLSMYYALCEHYVSTPKLTKWNEFGLRKEGSLSRIGRHSKQLTGQQVQLTVILARPGRGYT